LSRITIGVASFQGDVEEHVLASRMALGRLGVEGDAVFVKMPEEIERVDALIIPGGESTVMGRLAVFSKSLQLIRQRVLEGLPVLGTCAGLIMLAKRVYDRVVGETRQELIGVLDVTVERNSYGRQRESFETIIDLPSLGVNGFRAVFIRAPTIIETGPQVEVIASLADRPIAVVQENIMGTTFHPELSGSTAFHELLIKKAQRYRKL
jgi:5'-phosphate synthase pdxT subunit